MHNTYSNRPALWEQLVTQTETRINESSVHIADPITFCKDIEDTCRENSGRALESIQGYSFENSQQEVSFFRDTIGYFRSRYIFASQVYTLEVGRPISNKQTIAAYLTDAMHREAALATEQDFIYRYLRSRSTYLDDRIFVRPEQAPLTPTHFLSPPPITDMAMTFGYTLSRIVAGDLLQQYLQDTLSETQSSVDGKLAPRLRWTDSKTGLIELAYALQSQGVFNDGKADLKDIMETLQVAFHVNLGNYLKTFQEILSRKTGYTNYIDRLRDKLLLRIKRIEERHDK
ncbi:RteC domain-containing protein [Dinghuibacter silviterrae]|uniref:RteC protein n=1 Tax=Dinghuibacter silviterrae TaxID=1539049 RepID=A0A4R8DHS7_9BACT|nr:RteC domain-containing protein [Dinghuibacter silviterrae]TDW97095.1 RteC protein [Dinghuibacter silviterrae]